VRERVDLDLARFAAGFGRPFAERLPLFLIAAVARVPRLAAVIFLAVLAADLPRDFCAPLALLTSIPSVEPILSATLTSKPSSFAGDFSSSVTEIPPSQVMGWTQQTLAAASADTTAPLNKVRASTVKIKKLYRPSPLNDPNQHHDDRENEQDVDESAQGIGRDQPQQPQNYKDYRYCPKQVHLLLLQIYSRRPWRGAFNKMVRQYGQFLMGTIR